MTSYQNPPPVVCAEQLKRNSMRTSARTVHLCVIAIAASAFCATASADMGRTAGSWGVAPSGAATYTIPIWVQPGPKGVQPSLAFTYNSQAGNGTMGVGWGLSGFSSIDRCPWTAAEDGTDRAILVNETDRFCLDGNKLRITSAAVASYGSANAEYQTEIANFSRVKSVNTLGTGPEHFIVHTKSGLILEYGNTTDSRVVLGVATTVYRWMLNKVSDREGNSYEITYTTNNAEGRAPLTVKWGKTDSDEYQYQASFNYSNKAGDADFVSVKQGADSIVTKKILNTVVVGYSSGGSTYAPVRQYVLGYESSPTTRRSRLIEIKECGASVSAATCLKPTSIIYQNGAAGVSSSPTTAAPVGSAFRGKYDFDGDGRTDIAYFAGTLKVIFSTGAGFTAPVDTGISGTPLIGHFTASNKDGFLVDVSGTWSYVGYNGSTFSTTSTGIPVVTGTSVSDYNGDGIQDLVWASTASISGGWFGYANLRLNTTTGAAAAPSFDSTVYQPFATSLGSFGGNFVIFPYTTCPISRACDINGDGAEDLSVLLITTGHCTGGPGGCQPHQTGYDLLTGGFGYYLANATTNGGAPFVGIHFNDDRCIDTIRFSSDQLKVFGCGSGAATALTLPAPPVAFLDWDGDGRTDIAVDNGGVIGVYLSNGTTSTPFSNLVTTSVPYNSGCTYYAADIEGDGLDDLVCSGSIYYSHNGNGSVGSGGGSSVFVTQAPDVASSITDGYGVSVSPGYVATSQSNYTKGVNTALPLVDVTKTLLVVGRLRISDGISTAYDLDYTYKGAREHGRLGARSSPGASTSGGLEPEMLFGPAGRSAGFEEMTIVDSRNGIKQKTTYEQLFPLTGMVAKAETFQSNATLISLVDPVNENATLEPGSNNQRYFPHASEMISESYEVGGSLDGDLITRAVRTFGYTDFTYGNVETDTTVVTDKDSTDSAYAENTWTTTVTYSYASALTSSNDWCIGFVSQFETDHTSTLPSADAVTRTVAFARDTADASKCRVKSKTTEPGNPQYSVTETYDFDGFGNIDEIQVVGKQPATAGGFENMLPRTTSINWGSTGQFPVSVIDPSGATTTFAYDYDLATLKDAFDANSTPGNVIKTSYLYDAFARRTRETRPDGTYTTWNYNDCNASGGCVYPTHKLSIAETTFDNLDGTISDRSVYFDAFDRPFVTRSRLLSGYQWSETQYDTLGRVFKQYMPCATSSASTSCRTNAVTNSYDVLNRLTQSSRPKTEQDGTPQLTTFGYAGRTQTVTDSQNNSTTRVTNVDSTARRLIDANNYAISFAYDAAGSLKGVSDNQPTTRLSNVTVHYGIQPFQVAGTDSALGAYTRTYNSLGELVGWTDAKGQTFSATYDELSRPKTRSEPNATSTTWVWGDGVNGNYNRGKLRRVTSVENGETYEETFSYDSRARLQTRSITIPIVGVGATSFAYDFGYEPHKGRLDTLTYPVSTSGYRLALKYGYQNGILQSIADANVPSTVFWTASSTDAWGHTTQETLGNNITTTRDFDTVTGWLSKIESGPNGNPQAIQNLAYAYDLVGNVTQRQDYRQGLTEGFYYAENGDNLYRLGHSTLYNGSTTATNLELTYDASGNIETKDEPTLPPLLSQSIAWTPYNYPSQITVGTSIASFAYGPERQRWKMAFNDGSTSETTYYIGGLLEMVKTGSATTYRHTIRGGSGPASIYSRWSGGEALRYVLGDHQGSTESFVESGTGTTTHASFSAFGMRRNAQTWAGEPSSIDRTTLDALSRQGYTYQTVLGSMGLNHMNGRVQDAVTGRFLSADPFITEPNYTQNFNRYGYVYNNPATFTDPSGFDGPPAPPLPPKPPRDTGGFPSPTCNGSTDMSACDSYMVEPCGNYGCSPYLGGGFAEASSAAAAHQFKTVQDAIGWTYLNEYVVFPKDNPSTMVCGAGGPYCSIYPAHRSEGITRLDILKEVFYVWAALATEGAGPVVEGLGQGLAARTIDPALVRFSQNSMSRTFRNGGSVDDLAAGLRSGTVRAGDVPAVRLVERNGQLFSLDNRRLWSFQQAQVPIPYRLATPQEAAAEAWKFTTTNEGVSILLRGP